MNIIIVGNGKIGFALAELLTQENHSITIVDTQEAAIRRATDSLDVIAVRGNGVSVSTLKAAGAASTDLLVAATSSDEVNMVCCLTAKNLGVKYTVARIRAPEYTSNLSELRQNLSIDMVINPESATAVEIARMLRFPAAANIETFCRGRVELIGISLQADDFIVGKPLCRLSNQIKKLSLLFCAAARNHQIIIPNGSFTPMAGDKLYLIGQPESLDRFFQILGRYTPKIRRVFLAGGGKITTYLADLLLKAGMQLKIVEVNESRCRSLSEAFPRATVICGDSTDQALLEQEQLTRYDAFVALTDRDEDNLILSLYSRQQGIQKTVTKCNHQNYESLARSVGLEGVLSPKRITASYILRRVRGMNNSQGSIMNALYPIAEGEAQAAEFTVGPDTRNLGVPLQELRLKPHLLLAVIVRGKEIIIPDGTSYLLPGDFVILITPSGPIRSLNDIFEGSGAPV